MVRASGREERKLSTLALVRLSVPGYQPGGRDLVRMAIFLSWMGTPIGYPIIPGAGTLVSPGFPG
jgi:hypothetical protein